MLNNGGMEGITRPGGWTRQTHTGQEYGEIFTPEGWTTFWKEGLPVPHDPDNHDGYGRPEMQVIQTVPPFLVPPRIHSGEWALKYFTFYRIHDAGIYQQVTVTSGQRLRLAAWAHAWSSIADNPYQSSTDGQGWMNFTFMVGIDPTGATDPWGASVVWGAGANLYDRYQQIPPVVVAATGSTITVFVRSTVLWPFKHCDAYVDDVTLEVLEEPLPPGTVPYYNREKYPKRVLVPPQGCSRERWLQIAGLAYDQLSTVSGSVDDALGHEPGQDVLGIFYDLPISSHADYIAFRNRSYPGAVVQFSNNEPEPPDPPEPPEPPEPPVGWTPINYVPKGTKLSFHCIGGYPVDRTTTLAQNGVTLSSIKLVQSIGDFPVTREPFKIGRMIDHSGQNLEGFDYTLGRGTPEQQAEARMNQLMPIYAPYKQCGLHLEIINEQDCQSPEQHVLLARFFMRAMTIAEANGYKIALFSHSMGTPEPGEWDAIANTGVFEQAAAGGHAISLHEYGDASGGSNSIICRYRYLYDQIILPRGLNIPLFITEYNVPDTMLDGDVFGQWVAYDNLVRQDPYVAGVHIFTLPTGMGWDNYANKVVANLTNFVNYAIAQKDIANG